jgi:pimeloyl-ACP methyl ester carboxylesterase
MQKQISFKDTSVVYEDRGMGPCCVLLHGYLEHGRVWESFAGRFPEGCRVIIPDLPGHGLSGTWGDMHSMDDLAGAIRAILDAEGIGKIFLVGHSMGGYVCMAFADLFPERLLAYSLFHSTCFADNDEKKEQRDREISLVLCGKKRQIVLVNIPKAFSTDNLDLMPDQVERARHIAMENSDAGTVALLRGMKERPDRSEVLRNPALPLLLIGGMKDNYISVEVFEKLVGMAPHARVLRLEESGHMGFVEEPEKALEALMDMLRGQA